MLSIETSAYAIFVETLGLMSMYSVHCMMQLAKANLNNTTIDMNIICALILGVMISISYIYRYITQ